MLDLKLFRFEQTAGLEPMKWISQILVPAAVLLAQLGRAADPLSIWEQRASGTANSLNGITYGDGQFVAVGDSGAIVASD